MSEIVEATPEEQQEIKRVMNDLYRENYRKAPRVIVAGGRDFNDYKLMKEKLDWLFFASDEFDAVPIKIVSGMADGADILAIRYADEREMTKILFPANWNYHRRMAGFLRNEDMLRIATHLVAFWNGQSHGTKHIIDIAREKGIPVWVFNYNGTLVLCP